MGGSLKNESELKDSENVHRFFEIDRCGSETCGKDSSMLLNDLERSKRRIGAPNVDVEWIHRRRLETIPVVFPSRMWRLCSIRCLDRAIWHLCHVATFKFVQWMLESLQTTFSRDIDDISIEESSNKHSYMSCVRLSPPKFCSAQLHFKIKADISRIVVKVFRLTDYDRFVSCERAFVGWT